MKFRQIQRLGTRQPNQVKRKNNYLKHKANTKGGMQGWANLKQMKMDCNWGLLFSLLFEI